MNKLIIKLVSVILLSGAATFVAAHTYFFGLTELTLNKTENRLEIIHQFTAHDFENAIAELKQEHFSPEHANYEEYIQSYIEAHFSLSQLNNNISLNWIGVEVKRGKLFIYQEAKFTNYLTGLLVKNDILVDTYTKQVNTLNFQDTRIKGSLTFTASHKVASIESIK